MSSILDFNITKLADDSGLLYASPYPDYFVAQVLNTLMVSPFLSKMSCDRDGDPWSPQGYDGWKRGKQKHTIKPANEVTSIQYSPVLKGHFFLLVLS